MKRKINIAIDGFSGTGKSSTAREVARKLGFTYLDTGAMYRAVTLAVLTHDIDLESREELDKFLSEIDISFRKVGDRQVTLLNGKEVEDEIRSLRVAENVSRVSAVAAIRRRMVTLQQEVARNGGVVMDGRDIGTVVLPNAELKIFMTASDEKRALRRQKELMEKGQTEDLAKIMENLKARDLADSTRAESPLRRAEDAIDIDTTHSAFGEQVDKIVSMAKALGA